MAWLNNQQFWMIGLLLISLLLLWYRMYQGNKPSKLRLIVIKRQDFGAWFTLELARPWYLRWQKLPPFQGGQSVLLEIPGEISKRRYSLVGWQAKPKHYQLGIKCEPQGQFSPRLSFYAQTGKTLIASTPSGDFVLPNYSNRSRAVMIAGGIGITPLLAMLQQWANKPQPYHEIILYWQLRQESEAIYQQQLSLLANYSLRVRILFSRPQYQSQAERINLELLQKELGNLNNSDFYLCASSNFLDELIAMLQQAGVSDDAIFYERFKLASGVVEGSSWNVEYAGHNFAFSGYNSLLEACEAQQLKVDSDCRTGSCGRCMMKLKQGQVSYPRTPIYQTPPGCILSCCAVPASHIRLAKK